MESSVKPFLHLVASDLLTRFEDTLSEFSNLKLLLPNHRARLFLNQYLANLTPVPIWQPRVYTINSLMYELSGLRQAQHLQLCYLLYNYYVEVMSASHSWEKESFDNFYFWANVMLNDFDQIDKYLIDGQKLYENIEDIKDIDCKFDEFTVERLAKIAEFLNMKDDGQQYSGIRSKYSQIWHRLGDIYHRFGQSLVDDGRAYEGLAYRQAVQQLDASDTSLLGPEQWVVVGFNAITPCERRLFDHLQKHNKALFYWDYDQYYTETIERHEAAIFMADNLKRFPNALNRMHFDNLTKCKERIVVVDSPTGVAQAKVLPRILDEITEAGGQLDTSTAVVLLDESLLMPVLSALPSQVENPNVSLEYPLRGTPAYGLVDTLFGLRQNARNGCIYHRDALNLLNHPYVRIICPELATLQQKIINNKLISVDVSNFDGFPIVAPLVDLAERSSADLCAHIARCIGIVASNLQAQESDEATLVPTVDLERELLAAIYKATNRLADLLGEMKISLEIKTLRVLFRQILLEERVSFVGEPLSGLQVMSLLETRTLDFDNVVLLSANDDKLPNASPSPSFILPLLRTWHGMPDYNHQNALSAYYFYRLLQRAKRVYMVYNNSAEASEDSRYIKQLEMESGLAIEKRTARFSVGLVDDSAIENISKTPEIMQKLRKLYVVGETTKFMSATALSRFKNCGIRFYLTYIVGLEEPNEMDEVLDDRGIGSILHEVIEIMYKDAKNILITADWIEKNATNNHRKKAIETAFLKKYDLPIDSLIGRNRLIVERIEYMLKQMVEVDMKHRTPYTLVDSEGRIEGKFEIEVKGESLQIALGGFIDRQDVRNERYRVVDFKTGKYEKNKCDFKTIDDLRKHELDGVFQLMFYSELVATKKHAIDANNIWPQLWFVRHNDAPKVAFGGVETAYGPHREAFRGLMRQLLEELFNPDVPFKQTNEKTQCETCAYNVICGLKSS